MPNQNLSKNMYLKKFRSVGQ